MNKGKYNDGGRYERKEDQQPLQLVSVVDTFTKSGEIREHVAKVIKGQYKSDITIVSLSAENKKLKEMKSPLELGKEVMMAVIGVIIGLSITSFKLIYLFILVILFGFRIILMKYGK